MTPGTRITLTDPRHRGVSAVLGKQDWTKRWWVHLDQPVWCHQLRLPVVSVRVRQKFIRMEE